MKWWQPALVAVGGLLAAVGIACGSANAGDVERPAAQAPSPQTPRIARLLDGFPLWIENGDAIPVDESLSADVRFGPYPPAREGVLDLVLSNPGDGLSIKGATVETIAEMRYMDHGTFRSSGVERTGPAATEGSYRVPLRLAMYGEWVVTVSVRAGDLQEQFDLLVVVNP